MTQTMTLAELTHRTGLDVLDHLERQVAIPVIDGMQAQGDLIVIPAAVAGDALTIASGARWRPVPIEGIELLRGAGGGNPHTLVAEHGSCEWTTDLRDRESLALGVIRTAATAYLIHPEHGGTGIAPGTYLVRRQRERSTRRGSSQSGGSQTQLIAD